MYGLGGYGGPVPSDPGMGKDWDNDSDETSSQSTSQQTTNFKAVQDQEPWWYTLVWLLILAGLTWLITWLTIKLVH